MLTATYRWYSTSLNLFENHDDLLNPESLPYSLPIINVPLIVTNMPVPHDGSPPPSAVDGTSLSIQVA